MKKQFKPGLLIATILLGTLLACALALSAVAQDLKFTASLGGCDNLFVAWFTSRNDVISQTLRYSDNFSPAIASSVRSFNRVGVGCGAHFGVTILQQYANGQSASASLGDNHNRPCDQCGATIAPVGVVGAAHFRRYTTADSLAAAFGSGITTVTASANSRPLPLSLGGVQVWVDEVQAGMVFVSPNQANFHVPPGIQAGLRSVRMTNAEGKSFFGDIYIQTQGPGVFTRDGTGGGVAAADYYNGGTVSIWATGINPQLVNASDVVLIAGGVRYPAQFVETPTQAKPAQFVGVVQINFVGVPYNGQGAFIEVAGYQSNGFLILKR